VLLAMTMRTVRRVLGGLLALAWCALAAAQDGAVYLDAGDPHAFAPAEAISAAGFPGKWYRRTVAFAARGTILFYVPAGAVYPDLTCAPGLRGRYNCYVGTREVNAPTGLQLKLSGRDLASTVTPALATPEVHYNREILWAKDVALDGQTVLVHYFGRAIYLNYLKFVPTARDGADAQINPATVKEEPLLDLMADWRRSAEVVPPGMQEIRYLCDPPPAPARDANGQGYVVYSRHTLDLIFPNTVPAAREVTSELRLAAARGEYEPVSFSVYSFADLGPCTVKVTGLHSGSSAIGQASLTVFPVACRNLRTGFASRTFMRAPALVEQVSTVDIPHGRSQQFWLTVHVPPDAPPGQYRGTITFTPARGRPTSLALRLRVYPFALREPRDVSWGMYDVLWAVTAEPDWLHRRFADMRAHGLTTDAYCGGLNSSIVLEKGRAVIKFDGAGGLEQGLDAYRDAGFTGPMVWPLGDDIWNFCAQHYPVGSDGFRTLYRQAIQSLLAAAQRRRWPGIIFQPLDEPGSYDNRPIPGFLERWAEETCLIKAAGGVTETDHIPFSTTDARLKAPLERALPCLDIFAQRFSTRPIWFADEGWWWDNMQDQVRQWGKRLWSYNINDANFFPELATMRFAYGYFPWLQGIKGQLTWSFQDSTGSPLNCLDGPYTDMMYRFPAIPQIGEAGGPSLMYECLREGTDDYRYLYTLSSLAAEARHRGQTAQADAAEEVLRRLAASVDQVRLREKCRYLECQWDESLAFPDGSPAVKGRFSIPNGWGFADYDRWRGEAAREIERLSRSR
jgi:hypothetical protein